MRYFGAREGLDWSGKVLGATILVWPQNMNSLGEARLGLRAIMKKITGNGCSFCYRKQGRCQV